MSTSYKVVLDKENDNTITIHTKEAVKIGIIASERQRVKFGQEVQEMKVVTTKNIEQDKIMISKTNNFFNLPLWVNYEMKMDGDELVIGPYIGVICSKTEKNIQVYLKRVRSYLVHYNNINGVILAFPLSNVNVKQKTIKGYLYNPKTKRYEVGTYKFPSAIYRNVPISSKWRKYFTKVTNNHFFNSQVFNKWNLYKELINYEDIKKYLPETIRYKQPKDINYFIEKYGAVFMKPLQWERGQGIIKITKEKEKYIVEYVYKKEKVKKTIDNEVEIYDYLKKRIIKRRYIMQQPLDIKINGNVIDFRVHMNKDQTGEWKINGIYCRKGVSDSIVSNLCAGAKAVAAKKILKTSYNMTEKEVEVYYKLISDLALMIGKAMDNFGGNSGRTGLDICIDNNKKIWFIESNSLPGHKVVRQIDGMATHYKIRESNMLYAKYLAGFPEKRKSKD